MVNMSTNIHCGGVVDEGATGGFLAVNIPSANKASEKKLQMCFIERSKKKLCYCADHHIKNAIKTFDRFQ